MKNKIVTGAFALALALALPVSSQAKQKAQTAPGIQAPAAALSSPSPAAQASLRPIPFHGKIAVVDSSGKKFALAIKTGTGRVLMVTDKTMLTKGGSPATFADITKDEEVRGSYLKKADGSLEARTVKLGPPSVAEQTAKAKAKAAKEAAKAKAMH